MDPVNTSAPVCFDRNTLRIDRAIQKADILKIRINQFCYFCASVVDRTQEELDESIIALKKLRVNFCDRMYGKEKLSELGARLATEEERIERAASIVTKALEARHQGFEAQVDAIQREELSQFLLVDVTFKR